MNNSEEWRKECEARDILTKPLSDRRKHLALVEQKRGIKGRKILEDEILRLWTLTRTKQ
jgi:hypothetical protein